MADIILPNDWSTREYQQPAWDARVIDGVTRLCLVWHRRAGKDSFGLNISALESQKRVGLYWHMLPQQTHARKVVWNGLDRSGRRMIDQAFPPAIRANTNKSEMLIEFKNGSMWQCVGSDNYDALIGSNPIGIVFSEFSVADPQAWSYLRPILRENGGWAIFIFTARQRNHGYKLAEMARGNPKWFYSKLTVDDTRRPDGTPVIGPDAVQEERDSGMSENMIQQEYYCDFDAMNDGALFGAELALARKENRIGHFPPDPALPVHTFWDIGVNDRNSILMVQATQGRVVNVGHYSNRNKGMAFYFKVLRDWAKDMRVSFGKHYGPHDIEVREYGDARARTRKQIALQDHAWRFEVTPNMLVGDQMEALRGVFPKLYINETEYEYDEPSLNSCVDALESASREFDEKLQTFRDRPIHDWTSHTVSAALNMGVNMRDWMFEDHAVRRMTDPVQMSQKWSPFD